MPIKNYTTKIAPEKTIGEIQGLLLTWKVREVSIRWDDQGAPAALWFVLPTKWGERSYLMPANVDGVWAVLRRTVNSNTLRVHAARVAWRTVQDWLEAQLAVVQAGSAVLEQVMLPYMSSDDGDRTVFDVAADKYQKALPAGKEAGR